MVGCLSLTSLADQRWPSTAHLHHTREEGDSSSHIDYVMISEHAAHAATNLDIDLDSVLGNRHGAARGLDHAIITVDIDVRVVLGVGVEAKAAHHRRAVSQIKYSDKERVQRFRVFAEKQLRKNGFHGDMNAVLGELELTAELRDHAREEKDRDSATWEQRRWRGKWDNPPDDHTLRWKISTALIV